MWLRQQKLEDFLTVLVQDIRMEFDLDQDQSNELIALTARCMALHCPGWVEKRQLLWMRTLRDYLDLPRGD
jgi:hypothetical protein